MDGFPSRDSPDEYSGLPGSFPHHRFQQHIPGFTGHIHKLRDTFGTTYAYSTRVAQQCPPSSPEPETHWDLRKGKREMTVKGHLLPGTGFMGVATPADTRKDERTYIHGSAVDVQAYYKTLELSTKTETQRQADGYAQVLIKSGTPHKAKSSINNGDNFYFAGPHMWGTTYRESYEEPSKVSQGSIEAAAEDEDEAGAVDMEVVAYRYRILEAVCGKHRLDLLAEQIREKVRTRMTGGGVELAKSFRLFAANNGTIRYDAFYHVAQDLGVDISPREARALFGRFDLNKDGAIVFYEFIDALLAPPPAGGGGGGGGGGGAPPAHRDASLYEQRHPTVRF